jgi:hypothetical protein
VESGVLKGSYPTIFRRHATSSIQVLDQRRSLGPNPRSAKQQPTGWAGWAGKRWCSSCSILPSCRCLLFSGWHWCQWCTEIGAGAREHQHAPIAHTIPRVRFEGAILLLPGHPVWRFRRPTMTQPRRTQCAPPRLVPVERGPRCRRQRILGRRGARSVCSEIRVRRVRCHTNSQILSILQSCRCWSGRGQPRARRTSCQSRQQIPSPRRIS